MRFWDSSAVVPLLVAERATVAVRRLRDQGMAAWRFTPLEVLSGLHRRHREGALGDVALRDAQGGLAELERVWVTIADVEPVERQARRLLAVHPLRTADALQLAAALVASDGRPALLPFVTLDRRLADAARREGFKVLLA